MEVGWEAHMDSSLHSASFTIPLPTWRNSPPSVPPRLLLPPSWPPPLLQRLSWPPQPPLASTLPAPPAPPALWNGQGRRLLWRRHPLPASGPPLQLARVRRCHHCQECSATHEGAREVCITAPTVYEEQAHERESTWREQPHWQPGQEGAQLGHEPRGHWPPLALDTSMALKH